MTVRIAVVGMACRYPDARHPQQLWENVLACRRAFRPLPSERLSLRDYFDADRTASDHIYATQAAVLEGYEFDRVRFRVVGSTYRQTDLAHWLALEVASEALVDAGLAEGEGLDRATVGVLLGNSLTGEFSRASLLRLRWPYVKRVVEAQLLEEDAAHWTAERRARFLGKLRVTYTAPFPEVGEESLAGGLSNTIAGRICNQFDLGGGGYTVDGACSSSLLAVANACDRLTSGELSAALVGGVDVSLDPFELVGFSRVGALASDDMRVYDRRSAGFWPGEGCGFVVLMREDDARAQGLSTYGVVRGWGISSDGSGGISRPEIEGQRRAIDRAYRRAGYGPDSVGYFEGHGTGTAVGDAVELRALVSARRDAGATSAAVVGSIKANIGHTKAAAGLAGFLKATLALHHGVIPPNTGVEDPHPELLEGQGVLEVSRQARAWRDDPARRASVSSMGFGGINVHVTLEASGHASALVPAAWLHATRSDFRAELFLFRGEHAADVLGQVDAVRAISARLSRSDLTDLSVHLRARLSSGRVRAAVVASTAEELTGRLDHLQQWLAAGRENGIDVDANVFLSAVTRPSRLGFLFPGQASPSRRHGGALERCFEAVEQLYRRAPIPAGEDLVNTAVAQPAIVTASVAALRVLGQLGVRATAAAGHSLGELVALHWAGAYDETVLLELAAARGKAMADLSTGEGAMASLGGAAQEIEPIVAALREQGHVVTVAGMNGPRQTVVSGARAGVEEALRIARRQGLAGVELKVSHAFHSPLVAPAARALGAHLAHLTLQPLQACVASTITGTVLAADADVTTLLLDQLTHPVRFTQAVAELVARCDVLIEVGPGRVLTDLARRVADVPVLATEAGASSLEGLLAVVAACFVFGHELDLDPLFAHRFARAFELLDREPNFLGNPCELAPRVENEAVVQHAPLAAGTIAVAASGTEGSDPFEVVRRLVAARAELPVQAVTQESKLLEDLHLNSISVGQIVVEAAKALGLRPPASPTDFADANVEQVARALRALAQSGGEEELPADPAGVDGWVTSFTVEFVPRPLRAFSPMAAGEWKIFAAHPHPLWDALAQLDLPGTGVLVGVAGSDLEAAAPTLLEAARAAVRGSVERFVIVHQGGPVAPLARTLHREHPGLIACVLDVALDHPQAMHWIQQEIGAASGFVEARYDARGERHCPVLRHRSLPAGEPRIPLTAEDVLLVTGGGKGIAAECALALARQTRARLVLMGRSTPGEDADLAANLRRFEAEGLPYRYVAADVVDAQATASAIEGVRREWGPITGVLHAAGRNSPVATVDLTVEDLRATVAPKLLGLRNVLAALDPSRLKLLVTFGSIIARMGLPGEADYALANEELARATEQFAIEHGRCRCVCLEWSVWSGVGMGERLARIDALLREGVHPITPDAGIDALVRILGGACPPRLVVSSRFGAPGTLTFGETELPLLRFLETPRVHYPDLELVVDCEVSPSKDPYLDDHVFKGTRLMPTVMSMEAMAQVARALTGQQGRPMLENLELLRPVSVPDAGITLRVAALVRPDGVVSVTVRDSETVFQEDDVRAECRFVDPDANGSLRGMPASAGPLSLDPEPDLYGSDLLFHGGRFRRVRAYRALSARGCTAEIAVEPGMSWFGSFLPQTLVLGDPGARDATLHAIQPCVPHVSLLPIGADRWIPRRDLAAGPVTVQAVERSTDGRIFVYDVDVLDPAGQLCERWEGLRLRIVPGTERRDRWVVPLLGPFLERRLQELLPHAPVRIAVERNGGMTRRERSDRALLHVVEEGVRIHYRADGKPEPSGGGHVSAAHAGEITLAVRGDGPVGCDVEPVRARTAEVWQGLLGEERTRLAERLARAGDDFDCAATRVWSAAECLKKSGKTVQHPLTLAARGEDGWVVLSAGSTRIATWVTAVEGQPERMVVAVATGASR